MSKKMEFVYDGKQYILEFTRKTVSELERKGFIASDVVTKPMSTLPTLFAGAFLANHRYVKSEVIDEIFSKMKNKDELIGKLAEMYNEPIMTLIEEPEEENKGNIEWTATW